MDQEWNKLLQIHEKTKNRNMDTLAEREAKKSLKMTALALLVYLSIVLNVNLA